MEAFNANYFRNGQGLNPYVLKSSLENEQDDL